MARILMDGFEDGQPILKELTTGSYSGLLGRWNTYISLEGSTDTKASVEAFSKITEAGNVKSGDYSLRFYWHNNNNTNRQYNSHVWRTFSTSSEIYGRILCKMRHNENDTLFPLGGDTDLINVRDASGNNLLRIRLDKTNKTFLAYNQANTLIGTSSTISPGAWCKMEFHIKLDGASGIIECWNDNVRYANFSGDTIGAFGNMDRIYIGPMTNIDFGNWEIMKNEFFFDDIAINDISGDINNERCGDGAIIGIKPKANGFYSDFTPLSGANWENVDDCPPDGDISYNESSTIGHIDTYTMEELIADKGLEVDQTIRAVAVERSCKYKTTPASDALYVKNTNGGYEGSENALAADYESIQEILEKDPVSNSIWTPALVDDTEFGIRFKS